MNSLLARVGDDVSESLDDLADIDEVDLLVGSVNVGLWSAAAEGDNLSLWVLSLEFLEEGDRATFTEGTEGETTEVFS